MFGKLLDCRKSNSHYSVIVHSYLDRELDIQKIFLPLAWILAFRKSLSLSIPSI